MTAPGEIGQDAMSELPQAAHWPEGAIFTLGHSTLSIERFIALLRAYGIERLADIRTVPRSRHNPQFNNSALADALTAEGIEYVPMRALGGLRHARKDSPNTGWRNASFRGYADYMQTDQFQDALEALIQDGSPKTRRHHVRRGGAVEVPPLSGRRRAECARRAGDRDLIGVKVIARTSSRHSRRWTECGITYPPEQAKLL